jgi:hypothetical protein
MPDLTSPDSLRTSRSTAETCELLVRLEQKSDINEHRVGAIQLWPLLRHVLWVELLRASPANEQSRPTRDRWLVSRARSAAAVLYNNVTEIFPRDQRKLLDETRLFVSRPGYLQYMGESNLYFDRIIDPLFFIARNRYLVAKMYIGSLPEDRRLLLPGFPLRPRSVGHSTKIEHSVGLWVRDAANQVGLCEESLLARFHIVLRDFERWYRTGQTLFASMPQLKRLYLACWYFPDMMGLTAAAKEVGVEVIDVQHGKQGKYQGMYSWWTRIPEDGYKMMPDRFWCWGRPSCQDILRASPNRIIHRPFVGGFPWIDWYRTFINPSVAGSVSEKTILFTLQGPQGKSQEPIPDFIVKFLQNKRFADWRIRFRNHPNFKEGLGYCQKRLAPVDPSRFTIADQKRNLYDEFLEVTHHITGYSSCCYEAESFGVPTLLFGEEAKAIYETDIACGRFSWTRGDVNDLIAWLEQPLTNHIHRSDQYVESSLSLTAAVLFGDHPV